MNRLIKKQYLISLALVLLLVFALTGCFSDNPTTQDIIDKWQAAENQVDTYSFDMAMTMKASFSGSDASENQNLDVTANGTGALDNANKQMMLNLNMNTEIPEQDKVSIQMNYYMLNDTMYMQINMPKLGNQWMKMKLAASQWEYQDQMAMQLELLKDAVQVNRVEDEEIDGIDCYVMELNPDIQKILDWVKSSLQQTTGAENLNMDFSQYDLSKIIKQISLKQWIDKDSYLLVRADVTMVMDINEADLATPAESSSTNMGNAMFNITESIKFKDYNKPVTIVLPAEAENAIDMSNWGK